MAVLAHNTWFTSLICDTPLGYHFVREKLTPAGNEGLKHLEGVMRANKTLKSLSLKNAGGKGAALGQFFVAMKENASLQLEHLWLPGNSLDVCFLCNIHQGKFHEQR